MDKSPKKKECPPGKVINPISGRCVIVRPINCGTLFFLNIHKFMYPKDRRKLALHIHSLLNSLRKTAILLQVSHSTISRWLKNQARKKYTKSKKTIYKSDLIIESIRTAIYPFISITKLTLLLQQTSNVLVSKELVRIAISKLGLSKKKARFYGEPNNLKEKTEIFLEQRDKYIKQNRRFLSIDETSFGRNGIHFNPIELCFSIVKREYYKSQDIEKSYSSLTPKHILAFFKKSLHTYGAF